MKELTFITGRCYGPVEQIITAKVVLERDIPGCYPFHPYTIFTVDFSDSARQISGRMELVKFDEDAVLDAYDRGDYI